MSSFKDKTAIVTGSSMGIGKAIAFELCKLGAHVVLNGRAPDRLDKTYSEFSKQGFSVIAVQADVTQVQDCKMLIQTALHEFHRIDILINNAAISMNERFEHLKPEIFSEVIQSHILGSAFPSWVALPEIKKTRGSIVFISSLGAMIGLPTASAYSAGKMAITALAQSLKIEMSGTGVHIGIVYAGFTKNDKAKRTLNAQGELIPLSYRPSYLQQTQEHVAKAVLKLIQRRKFKITLSILGKVTEWATRFSPRLALTILNWIYSRHGAKFS